MYVHLFVRWFVCRGVVSQIHWLFRCFEWIHFWQILSEIFQHPVHDNAKRHLFLTQAVPCVVHSIIHFFFSTQQHREMYVFRYAHIISSLYQLVVYCVNHLKSCEIHVSLSVVKSIRISWLWDLCGSNPFVANFSCAFCVIFLTVTVSTRFSTSSRDYHYMFYLYGFGILRYSEVNDENIKIKFNYKVHSNIDFLIEKDYLLMLNCV